MQNRVRNHRFIHAFEIVLYVICGLSIIYFGTIGAYGKCFQAALIITVLLLFRGLIIWTKSELPPALRLSVLIFIVITMMLANLFNMYAVIPYLDKIEHLMSGVILFFVGQFIVNKMAKRKGLNKLPATIIIWFAFYFSIAMAGVWEIYEFTVDQLFGLVSQNGSLTDTMIDIICGTVGAVCAVIYQLLNPDFS
ncbi:hypothetical protein I6N90_16780 [Paenibacillus sp. GSMTC-2017]|uniref:hypothetical protein n=1 Tax=Paenibacillus sp. GSMTC-2017 TaxID=2794350 RepID=UPI0018D842A4|nr:hypothetical protein [Paenibacillus sp. GSMTC-2017]MBH5319453.1 hypothetical protein [Paenibacillus sp. GSMTC-2017]